MAEAVFTLSADITPQLDERALEQQAQILANQLNRILSKQIDKVSIRPETGNFRPFQQEMVRTTGFVDKLQSSANALPRTFGNVARSGRNAFLKFSDAIKVTRRDFVGFGGGIRDTIRQTNLFESALDNIKDGASELSGLPETFQTLVAQVRSGTSELDRMASSGDKFAQALLPSTKIAASSEAQLGELTETIEAVSRSLQKLGNVGPKALGGTRASSGKLDQDFNELLRFAESVGDVLPKASFAQKNFFATLDQASSKGGVDDIIEGLVLERESILRVTGPMGRLLELTGRLSKEDREAAITAEQALNKAFLARGGALAAQLGPIETLTTRLRNVRDSVLGAARGFEFLRTGLAKILPGASPIGVLVDGASKGLRAFQEFGSTAVRKIGFVDTALNKFKARNEGPGFLDKIFPSRITPPTIAPPNVKPLKEPLSELCQDIHNCFKSLGLQMDAVTKKAGAVAKAVRVQNRDALGRFAKGFKDEAVAAQAPQVQKAKSNVIDFPTAPNRRAPKGGSTSGGGGGRGSDTGGIISGAAAIEGAAARSSKALGLMSGAAKLAFAPVRILGSAFGSLAHVAGSLLGSGLEFAKSAATVAGVAFAGLAASAIHAGIEFNTLQQVVNGTLPVLVGSKKAAAGLLAEVNALNDDSPFARSAFLQLTQTLAGFGVEAKKITPLIDAIQQTVAATGGGEGDLQELGGAFARIQSQGRLSLDVLQSFSSRGVDAIGILGQAMGKTQSEIRDMISNGLIPADKAIDELTKGLKEKFDGATDAVSKNLPGALDRIKAKLRDAGALLTKAFVDPEGGGALVDFLNHISDSIKHLTNEILPKLTPLLQKAADAFVTIGSKIEVFVTSLNGATFQKFIDGLGPVLPLLAAFVGFLPAMLGFLPVVGPLVAGLGGPFTALAAALTVVAVQSGRFGEIMKSIKDVLSTVFSFISENLSGVIGALGIGLSQTAKVGAAAANGIGAVAGGTGKLAGVFAKIEPLFQGVLAAFPRLVNGLKFLSGPIGIVIGFVAQLVLTSQGFRAALGRLIEAAKPVAEVIGGVLAVAIQILDGVLKALEPIFIAVVNILASLFEALKPGVEQLKQWIKNIKDSGIIGKIFEKIAGFIQGALEVIQKFIDAYNKLPFLPEIKVKLVVEGADKATNDLKEHKKLLEAQKKAAKESADAVSDNFNAASKAVAEANTKMSGAIDSLKQGLQSIDQKISPIFESAKAFKAATQAVVDAKQGLTDAQTQQRDNNEDFTQLLKDQARAFEDVIKPVDELGVATRSLTRIQNGLRDSQRELDDLAKERRELLGQEAADDRAGLARSETRAVIALNKAKQAQLDLENELNNAGEITLDLTGLSIDQIKTQIAGARAVAKAKGRERDETQQEKDDRRTEAGLDVEDAKQGVKDSQNASLEFEEGIKDRILEIDERTLEIQDDVLDKKLEERSALVDIERLRKGENAQAALTKEFDEKIKEAKKQQAADSKTIETASKAIQTATQAAQLANLEFQKQSAIIRGDVSATVGFQQQIWQLQQNGVDNIAPKTLKAIQDQKSSVQLLLDDYKAITAEVQKTLKLQSTAATLQGASSAITSFENLSNQISSDVANDRGLNPTTLANQSKTRADFFNQLRAALGAGAAEDKNSKQPVILATALVDNIIREIENQSKKVPLRDAVRDILNKHGWSMPGFAAAKGLSPGMIHRGMNDGKGLVRMFEFGKEAVLPLTRPSDMARIVNDPAVLGPILNALNLTGMASGSPSSRDDARVSLLNARDAQRAAKAEIAATEDMQKKLLEARKRAAEANLESEASLEAQEEIATRTVDKFKMQAIAMRDMNNSLLQANFLLEQIAARGGAVAGGGIDNALTDPASNLRQILVEVFKKLGLQFPGFSTGYAPGDLVHNGMNNGVGMARMFEYGREAVLPLTRGADLARVIRSPNVLPAVLNALPRWSRPAAATMADSDVSDLATIVRSNRSSGGPANAEVYQKKSQREFAATIGESVKIAVKEAIAESGGLGGDDVDINIMPSSGNERLIARAVKREMDKRTGKW